MKIKRIALMIMAITSSVSVIGLCSFHHSIKNERVKVEILDGSLDVLKEDTLVFSKNNGAITENSLYVSSTGMESKTIKYSDKFNIITNEHNYTTAEFSDSFKTKYSEVYKLNKDKFSVWQYHINFNENNKPYILNESEKNIAADTFNLEFYYYDENEIFKEETIVLERTDFANSTSTKITGVYPITVYKENDIIKFVASTDLNSSEVRYDYIEYNLKTKDYTVKELIFKHIKSSIIYKDNLYILGAKDEKETLYKLNINNFDNIEKIYCPSDKYKENSKKTLYPNYYPSNNVDKFENTFEFINVYECGTSEDKEDYSIKMNIALFDPIKGELKEYTDLIIMDNEDVSRGLDLNEYYISNNKLFLIYAPNFKSYVDINDTNYAKVIDLNTRKTVLTLKSNTGIYKPSLVIGNGGNYEEK